MISIHFFGLMEIFGYFISSFHLYGWKWWNKVVENFHKIFALFALISKKKCINKNAYLSWRILYGKINGSFCIYLIYSKEDKWILIYTSNLIKKADTRS